MVEKTAGFFRRNGLSVVVLLFMAAAMLGQVISGRLVYNAELAREGVPHNP